MRLRATLLLLAASPGGLAAQADWVRVTTAVAPANRFIHTLSNGPGGTLVLFGGAAGNGPALLGDTWVFDRAGWRLLAPAGPSARAGHGMTFDLPRQRVVLFGGMAAGPLDDTWEWDGTGWLQIPTGTRPSARQQFAIDFDLLRGRTVVFGGYDSVGLTNDTWEYDGSTWRRILTRSQPTPRGSCAMAMDLGRARMVLFGGHANGPLGDTWEYDGVDWQRRQPAQSPPIRCCNALVGDLLRGRVVLFGGATGFSGADFGDTWEYDGNTWLQRSPNASPSARRGTAATFDLARARLLLFGGGIAAGGTPTLGDTWEYLTPLVASARSIAPGCATSSPQLAAMELPWLGDPVHLQVFGAPGAFALLALGLSTTTWNGQPLPLSLAPLGMPGCALAVSCEATVPMLLVANAPQCTLQLPPLPAFAGRSIFAQALVADANANAAGFVLSDALALTLGAR